MKFGKEFRIHLEKTLPEWRDKFLCYKLLKKLLKRYPASVAVNLPPDVHAAAPLPALQEWFVAILYEELEKFNDFYVEKEEDFIIRFSLLFLERLDHITMLKVEVLDIILRKEMYFRNKTETKKHPEEGSLLCIALKERIERVKERARYDGMFTSETEFSEDMMMIRKDFVAIHGEMVLLKTYSSLNFAGLIKILKKYDKRTGELLSLPFTQLAFYQPFFTIEPLTRLVRECEENLEILFPLESEVVEPTTVAEEQTSIAPSDMSNASLETTLPLGEETVDIYRSTVAAINNDSTGDVTAENSPCNSDMEDEDDDICSSD
ncbi:hypothetical protein DH2020_036978 [Rehmannia glutinosa]|uniref:SPX domain-containing protein n=1 Tax=Rehmannia glutinosa TaxID=99300 RepID=A0ABR0V4R1_REHGL